MNAAVYCLLALTLTACAGQPTADPQATVVLADIQPALECPEPVPVQPPADLIAPLELASPEILPGGQGDYGITREGLEMLVDALRAAGERLSRWRAWAQ